MWSLFRDFFGKKEESKALPQNVTGESVYTYLMKLCKEDGKRLDKEISDRGLSFGELRVEHCFGCSVTLSTPYEKTKNIGLDALSALLSEIISENKLEGVVLEKDSYEISLVIADVAAENLRGVWQSGWKNGASYEKKIFLTAKKFNGISIEAYSADAIDVVLLLAKKIGLQTEPAQFAFESDVPLREIVEHSICWQDPETGKYYTELKYDHSFKKSLVYIGGGSNEEFSENEKTIVVLASEYKNNFRINNLEVPVGSVSSPSEFMLKMREKTRERYRKRNVCKVDDCSREVAFDLNVTRYEINDGFGVSSSTGSIYSVCDDPVHLEKLKKTVGGIKQSVTPVSKEKW